MANWQSLLEHDILGGLLCNLSPEGLVCCCRNFELGGVGRGSHLDID